MPAKGEIISPLKRDFSGNQTQEPALQNWPEHSFRWRLEWRKVGGVFQLIHRSVMISLRVLSQCGPAGCRRFRGSLRSSVKLLRWVHRGGFGMNDGVVSRLLGVEIR